MPIHSNPTSPGPGSTFAAQGGMSVTPDNDNDIVFPNRAWYPRGISFGTDGTLSIITKDGSSLTYSSGDLAAGVIHPISVARVLATGTTAARIKVYW